MNAARTEQPIEPSEDDAARDLRLLLEMFVSKQAEVDAAERDKTRMQRDIDELRYWRRIRNDARKADSTAQAAKDAQDWLPLTMAAVALLGPGPYEDRRFPYDWKREKRNHERVRKWCELGKIVCKKSGELWMVEMNSAWAYAATKGIFP
jgi:hypothetical protein